MNIVFFGSSKFGEPSLRKLMASGYRLTTVVTQPDTKQGRGLCVGSTAIKDAASELGLEIFQPASINSPESIAKLKSLKPDVFVIIAYGQKFCKSSLAIPAIMPINVHASILPKYRGAAPINWAIINGERETGNTIMKVVPAMDAGPIILQSRISIRDDDTAVTLEEKLAQDAPVLLLESLRLIEARKADLHPQEESKASLAPKLSPAVARINWNQPAVRIHNLVRGCLSWSAAFTTYRGKFVKIYTARVNPEENHTSVTCAGEIINVTKRGIFVGTIDGTLCIEELQLEGKKRMSASAFMSGAKISPGERFGP